MAVAAPAGRAFRAVNVGMPREFARYWVALKILLRRGNRYLLLKTAKEHRWDLPGGRIDDVEGEVPLEKILAREVREELGPTLRYELGGPLLQFRRQALAVKSYNLVTVYAARYRRGTVKLSHEHQEAHWLTLRQIRTLPPREFFSREEYAALRRHFNRNTNHRTRRQKAPT